MNKQTYEYEYEYVARRSTTNNRAEGPPVLLDLEIFVRWYVDSTPNNSSSNAPDTHDRRGREH